MSSSWLMIIVGLCMVVVGLVMCMYAVYMMTKYKRWLGLTKEGVCKDPELMRVFSVYSRPKHKIEKRPKLTKQEQIEDIEDDCDPVDAGVMV